MENTNIKVEFILMGAEFIPENATNKLNIKPDLVKKRGELLKNGNTRSTSSWIIETAYQESLDINEQINEVYQKIKDKRNILVDLYNSGLVESRFCIVIKIENGQTPAMTLSREFIDFVHAIRAEIEFDTYANPWDSGTDGS